MTTTQITSSHASAPRDVHQLVARASALIATSDQAFADVMIQVRVARGGVQTQVSWPTTLGPLPDEIPHPLEVEIERLTRELLDTQNAALEAERAAEREIDALQHRVNDLTSQNESLLAMQKREGS